MKVVVTGATGFIGTALVAALRAQGDEVVVLSRDAARAQTLLGDVTAVAAALESPGPWCEALAGCEAIIHLAGEPIGTKRLNARQKQIVRDSRVEATRTLVEALAAMSLASRPRVLISASGADYYPFAATLDDFDDDPVTERDEPGETFLARVCRDWEREARAAEGHRLRVACMRTGLVIGPGGVVGKLSTPFKLFVGGRIGDGRQWVSWIHRDDVVAAYLAAIRDERYTGPINLTAPDSTRNAELAAALGRALGRPSWLPVPGFALRLALGELAEYILHGRRVVPAVLLELGFRWRHPTIQDALAAI